jgi:hypothetical protein
MSDVEKAFRSWADKVRAMSEASGPVPVEAIMHRGARRRRRKFTASTSIVLVAAAIAVTVIASGVFEGGGSRVQVRGTPTSSSVENRYVPVASTSPGGDQRLVVPLLDGTTFAVSYPARVNIAALGMTASVEIAWPGASATSPGCCQPNALAFYTDLRTQFGASKPLRVFAPTPSGQVDLMPGDALGSPHETFLVFRFGKWLLEIPDAGSLGDSNLSTLAANLSGFVDPSGYLHLSLHKPLTALLHPAILFGAATVNSPQVEVTPRSCPASSSQPFQQGDGESGVAVCDSQGLINASATGPKTFVDEIASGLKLGPGSS